MGQCQREYVVLKIRNTCSDRKPSAHAKSINILHITSVIESPARDDGRDSLFRDCHHKERHVSSQHGTSCSMTPLGRFDVGNGIAIMESTPAKDGKKFIFFPPLCHVNVALLQSIISKLPVPTTNEPFVPMPLLR